MTESAEPNLPSPDELAECMRRRDRLAKHLGIRLDEIGPGYARTSVDIEDIHLNSLDMVHGGTMFALADFAFAAACNSYGTVAVAINIAITYIKAATGGALTAEAREVSKNAKLGTYAIDIRDGQGELIATFQGLAYRKPHAIEIPPE